ncbi:hypothetical protein D3C86_1955440 [compost metagenome]
MFVGLTGVVPEEFTFIEARVGVEFEVQGFDLGHAFECVQARASRENRRGIGVWPALADQSRIACTGQITGAGKQAASLFQSLALDNLPPQRAEG